MSVSSAKADDTDNIGLNIADRASFPAAVNEKVGSHPTSSDFEVSRWDEVLERGDLPPREHSLFASGRWIGARLSSLRSTFPDLFAGFTADDAVKCAIGYANAAYLQNRIEFNRARKREGKRIGVGTTLLGHTTMKVPGSNQVISEDHLATTIVDSLSHALFYAHSADPGIPNSRTKGQEAARAFRFSNIEFVYRATWQQVLWEGYEIHETDSDVFLRPCSEQYGSWWPVWDVRRQNLIAEQLNLMSRGLLGPLVVDDIPPEFQDLVPRRRVTRANFRDGRWHFKFADVSHRDFEYRSIIAASAGIRQAGLWPYVNEMIPRCGESGLTLGDLLKVWQVLESAIEAVAKSVSKMDSNFINDIRNFSFDILSEDVGNLIELCTGLGIEKAKDALEFLSTDVQDTRFLFNRGVWANPIVRDLTQGSLAFVLPVLTIGNIVRAFENWIEQCEFAKSGELKGANFETEVVEELRIAAAETELPVRVLVFGPSLKIAGEEIDAILIVGDLVLVLECKNFLTPGDSIERFNTVKRIRRGASQAERKARAVRENKAALVSATGVAEEDIGEILGVVVVASPYGVGLNFGPTPVVDLDFLVILAGSTSIVSAMLQRKGEMVREMTHMYEPFGFSTTRFSLHLRRPFVQTKYFDALKWSYEPFPSGDTQKRFMLPFPLIAPESDARLAKDLLAKVNG